MSAGRPILLAGPTASGKSAVALCLAEQLRGEIISVDSMQVYRGLDLGTAKPSAADRARVPHHLIDVAGLDESFDAARFIRLAHAAVAEIQARGRVPVLCGGTGFYFKAFLEGLGPAPRADETLRAELTAMPLAELLRELEARDPEAFQKIDRQNPRRVIRAVEVIRLTGKPFSAQRTARPPAGDARLFCLRRESADLHARIDARVDEMFQRDLVAETQQLLAHGLADNPTAMQAIGYRQVVEHLRGGRPLAGTIELVKIRTHQFARRQMTWFRRQAGVTWLAVAAGEPPGETARRLGELLRADEP